MKKIIIIVLILAVILGIAFFVVTQVLTRRPTSQNNQPVTITVWGLWEDDSLMRTAIENYKKVKPNVTVNYVYQSSINYRSRVQTQIANNQGPDVFMIHDTWVPMFLKTNSLSVMPETIMSAKEYAQIFYPVATDTLTVQNKIYAVPREVDGLAMYYNEDILKAQGIAVPQNWVDFTNAAIKTTVTDQNGRIVTAGAALGSPSNVDHWSDILGLLFLEQPGASLGEPNTPTGAEVVKFFTRFITDPTQKVWDQTLPHSTQMFAEGRLAFYFAPSWRAFDLRNANPQLNFKTAPVPQLPQSSPTAKGVGWGSFWAYAVSSKSVNQQEAWEFVNYLTSAETEKQLYQTASETRLFGLPYSRVELQKDLINDPVVGPFVAQAPIYKSWYLSSNTFDQGINDEMIKYYEDAVNATLNGADPLSALETTAQGVKQVLDKYSGSPVPQ